MEVHELRRSMGGVIVFYTNMNLLEKKRIHERRDNSFEEHVKPEFSE
jgi:hypothetical protein